MNEICGQIIRDRVLTIEFVVGGVVVISFESYSGFCELKNLFNPGAAGKILVRGLQFVLKYVQTRIIIKLKRRS